MFNNEDLIHKIESLPEESRREVEDFVDFLLHKKEQKTKVEKSGASQIQSLFGAMKGKFIISSDFNEPLDDFKEYME